MPWVVASNYNFMEQLRTTSDPVKQSCYKPMVNRIQTLKWTKECADEMDVFSSGNGSLGSNSSKNMICIIMYAISPFKMRAASKYFVTQNTLQLHIKSMLAILEDPFMFAVLENEAL